MPYPAELVNRAEDWPWSSFRQFDFADEYVLKMDRNVAGL